MLYTVMRYCRNFFVKETISGTFEVKGGKLSLPFVLDGQYILIEGSVFNDDVYRYPINNLEDETFHGYVSLLAPPKAFIETVKAIEKWNEKYFDANSPYQSESFGGYSYTKATNASGGNMTWKDAFAGTLSQWRKI